MPKNLLVKLREALSALLPITIIVLILNFTITPMPFSVRWMFIIGAILLVIGMGFFTLGADLALLPIGEHLGQYLSKSKKLPLVIISTFLLGLMITIAEPDLQVLAEQVSGVPTGTLIMAVAIGVGVLMVVAVLRILFQFPLSYMLIILYGIVFLLGAFIPQDYLPVSFDASGVTTGPLTVPFILAFGVGVAAVRGGKSSQEDSFGIVALCSIGPILAVMVLTLFNDTGDSKNAVSEVADVNSMQGLTKLFIEALPEYASSMFIALAPIILFFLAYQLFAIKLPLFPVIKILVGAVYTYVGLVLFLTGVEVGFLPAGTFIGQEIGGLSYNWILIPLGLVMGYFIVYAEPAVHVLIDQIEELSGGAVSKRTMLLALSISVGLSVGLAMVRVVFGISIWYILIPGYLLALGLTFVVPKMFTAIAFDSGGAASGPMTTTFLLPFAMGACSSIGGNILMDAFGTVAMVAMTPLFTIQIVGLIYKIKVKDTTDEEQETIDELADEIEEQEFIDWGAKCDISDVYDDYNVDVNLEFVASPEWAEEVRDINIWETITSDNDYIDFDELDFEAFNRLLKPEDFAPPDISNNGNNSIGSDRDDNQNIDRTNQQIDNDCDGNQSINRTNKQIDNDRDGNQSINRTNKQIDNDRSEISDENSEEDNK